MPVSETATGPIFVNRPGSTVILSMPLPRESGLSLFSGRNFQDRIAAQRLSPILFRLKGLHTPRVILKGRIMSKSRVLVSSAFLALSAVLSSAVPAQTVAPKVAKVTVRQAVTLIDDGDSWTMDNGIVKLTVA